MSNVGHYVRDTGGVWTRLDGTDVTGPPPPPQQPYTGPIIWGASEPDGGTDQDPAAKSWSTLRSDTIAAGGVFNAYRIYGAQSGLPLDGTTKTRHNTMNAMAVKHVRCDTGGTSAWANIANGVYDSTYDQLFADMLNLTYGDGITAPTNSVFTLDAEFDRFTQEFAAPKGKTVHGTGQDFINAWVHLYQRLRGGGTGVNGPGPNVNHPNNKKLLFGWAPQILALYTSLSTNGMLPSPGFNLQDKASIACPPDQYVDIFAPDAYNKYAQWHGAPSQYLPEWHEMGDLFDLCREWTVNTGKLIGKQMLIVEGDCQEWGSTTPSWDQVAGAGKGPYPAGSTPDGGTHKANWFTNAITYIKANPDCIGITYWNVTYPPSTTATAYQGWKDAAVAAGS